MKGLKLPLTTVYKSHDKISGTCAYNGVLQVVPSPKEIAVSVIGKEILLSLSEFSHQQMNRIKMRVYGWG